MFFLGFCKPSIPRIGFFIFNVHLVAIGIVYEFMAFLGTIWTSRHVGRRVLVLLWGEELLWVVGLMALLELGFFFSPLFHFFKGRC